MTILNSNQDWPQVYFRRWSSEVNGWIYGYEDKSVVDVILNARDQICRIDGRNPRILFAGPKAWHKIEDLISKESWVIAETRGIFERRKKEFLGLELILTIDDGLWIM